MVSSNPHHSVHTVQELTGRVFGTSLLISFISYSSQIWVIWPWYGRTLSVDLLKLLVPFKSVSFLFLAVTGK